MQKEGELKKAIEDNLQLRMNRGELFWDRLNSGAIFPHYGGKTYKVKLCREGSADIFVLAAGDMTGCRVLYLEMKTRKGKQGEEQRHFEEDVTMFGAQYALVRTFDEYLKVIEGFLGAA